jgi:hypothetical protein
MLWNINGLERLWLGLVCFWSIGESIGKKDCTFGYLRHTYMGQHAGCWFDWFGSVLGMQVAVDLHWGVAYLSCLPINPV